MRSSWKLAPVSIKSRFWCLNFIMHLRFWMFSSFLISFSVKPFKIILHFLYIFIIEIVRLFKWFHNCSATSEFIDISLSGLLIRVLDVFDVALVARCYRLFSDSLFLSQHLQHLILWYRKQTQLSSPVIDLCKHDLLFYFTFFSFKINISFIKLALNVMQKGHLQS